MKVLCTFSGKNGDILWSLPTARQISKQQGVPVDFAIMPYYKDLLPLIQYQSYIGKAFAVEDWYCQNSHYGDQPWSPPAHVGDGYDIVIHLGYRSHPGGANNVDALIDFIAKQQCVCLDNPIPFIETPEWEGPSHFAYGFNFYGYDIKKGLIDTVSKEVGGVWIDSGKLPWLEAASCIKSATGFIGCRSSNNVLAHGVGQKHIFIIEPDDTRMNKIFGCPYGSPEIHPPKGQEIPTAIYHVKSWRNEEVMANSAKERKENSLPRPLVGSLHPEDYQFIFEGVQAVKESTEFFKSKGCRIEIPVEHRYWEYGTCVQMLLDKYKGNIPTDISVLDVGAGWGAFGPTLAYKYGVTVTESEPSTLERNDRARINSVLRELGKPELVLMDKNVDALPDTKYDMVACISVIEHIPQNIESSVWKILGDRVKSGGLLFIDVDCVEYNHRSHMFDNLRTHNYTVNELADRVEVLKVLGFKPIHGEEYLWNGSYVYDYTFFRVGMEKC